MDNRQKVISAALITGVVFMIFLYSPIASPDLYRTENQYGVNISPGVRFKGGSAQAYTSINKGSGYQEEYSQNLSDTRLNDEYSAMQGETGTSDLMGQSSFNNEIVYTTSQSKTSQAGGNLALSSGLGSKSSAKNKLSSSTIQSYGFQAMTANLSTVNSQPEKVNATNSNLTDPGGNPTENAIPVSDGLGLLLILALVYLGWKSYWVTIESSHQNRKEQEIHESPFI